EEEKFNLKKALSKHPIIVRKEQKKALRQQRYEKKKKDRQKHQQKKLEKKQALDQEKKAMENNNSVAMTRGDGPQQASQATDVMSKDKREGDVNAGAEEAVAVDGGDDNNDNNDNNDNDEDDGNDEREKKGTNEPKQSAEKRQWRIIAKESKHASSKGAMLNVISITDNEVSANNQHETKKEKEKEKVVRRDGLESTSKGKKAQDDNMSIEPTQKTSKAKTTKESKSKQPIPDKSGKRQRMAGVTFYNDTGLNHLKGIKLKNLPQNVWGRNMLI
ncbi:hypothetical protein RFI_38055, partial [Reticulomyxa filosa]